MIGSNAAQDRLFLTADFQLRGEQAGQSRRQSGRSPFDELQRFPPIEDLVASLDTIASRATAA